MENKIINKIKKYNINFNFYYIFFIILILFLIFFTFFDLKFSYLIADIDKNQYLTNNNLALFVENYGEYILYFLFFASVLFMLVYMFLIKHKNNTLRKLFVLALSIFLITTISTCVCQFLKKCLFERIRFRSMNYVNDFSLYSPWFFINNSVDSNTLQQISIFSDALSSFPSGHTMAIACSFFLFIVPSLFHIKSKVLNILLYSLPIVLTVFVGFERIVAGAHFATDIIGSMLICLMIVFFVNIFALSIIYKQRGKNAIQQYNKQK